MLIRLVATWLPHAQEANWDQKGHKIYTNKTPKSKTMATTTTEVKAQMLVATWVPHALEAN